MDEKKDHGATKLGSPTESRISDVDAANGLTPAKRDDSLPATTLRPDGKRELTEDEAFDCLGYSYPTWKKWTILSVIFIVQVSMNFNTSIYPNAVPLLAEHFEVKESIARLGQMTFLVAYAFGSELWAPWSEELGRWPILQASLFLVNSTFIHSLHLLHLS